MKSRTSSFNFTVLKKDITRFAPLWVLYIVCSLLMLTMLVRSGDVNYYLSVSISESIPFMAWVNAGYALLCAQLLFGDLFSSRMCNALHAMPMRREGWFATHILSGILFSFVPHLIFTLLTMPLMGPLWEVGLWWMLAVDLQFLFFFGLAVLSMLCVGSRFAAVVVYGLLNFLSMLVFWLLDTLYVPMLYGLVLFSEPFQLFCPLLQMTMNDDMVNLNQELISPTGVWPEEYRYSYTLGEGWGYLAVCAVVGLALLGLALAMYRKRNLESAGDFMAVRALKPVFLAIYTITAGAVCYLFFDLFGTSSLVFLLVGVAIGFFTGQMLLMRTVRVFGKKQLIGFAATIGVLALSLVLTALDPLGIKTWVPKATEVKSVTVSDNLYMGFYQSYNYGRFFVADEPEEIADVLQIHQFAIDEYTEPDTEAEGLLAGPPYTYPYTYEYANNGRNYTYFCVTYELTNGLTAQRQYYIPLEGEQEAILRKYYSTMECLFGPGYAGVEALLEQIDTIYTETGYPIKDRSQNELEELLRAMEADCEAGTMAQNPDFHLNTTFVSWLTVTYSGPQERTSEVRVYKDAVNTYTWLKERGHLDEYEEKYYG